ncbi:hypothetical protein HW555_001317 [Spodoptera exigua]|uniref:DRBM domain-containing protein n=1 Tax=Spodoptera exigua TaxID=7107 RepID=A0A835GQP6_SPOEX|nr:hypothetical protein HW555_001317 [Spodoptera exigua]
MNGLLRRPLSRKLVGDETDKGTYDDVSIDARGPRVPLGPAQAGGAMGAHGQALGGLGAMGVPPPHHTPQRPPHPIRAMPHHPQAQHHSVPPQQMKALRRPYAVSGGYGPGAAVMPPPYAQPPPMQPPAVPIAHTGPAHKKVFTVTLRLGDTEEYTAEGSSIKRAQHAAAQAALGGTSFPPPPPRAPAPHAAHHPHHRHAGMCTTRCLLDIATFHEIRCGNANGGTKRSSDEAVPAGSVHVDPAGGGPGAAGAGAGPGVPRGGAAGARVRRARAAVPRGDNNADLLSSEVKSPVSLVHELALKRNLSVQFTVKSERGPPHMRVFVTACTVGDMETEGEGNGKKVSKRRAAERMLDEMRRRWPPALLRARPPQDKRRTQPAKKKPRNLIKVSEEGAAGGGTSGGADNPISRLAFLVHCDAPPHSATGLGPNKKTAKRRAAHNVLLAMEMSSKPADATQNSCSPDTPAASPDSKNADTKRKSTSSQDGDATGEVRQPVPGVLLMDYHQRTGQPVQPNGVSETSATGGSGGNTPGAKDQLMYLSQLLGFSVQFSDFPKRNHGEYLSLVSLSTEPPVMCHGGGPSTAHSHEQCSRAALRALTLMGLDAPTHPIQSVNSTPAKTSVVSNGIAE